MVGPHRLPCETPEAHKPSDGASPGSRWVLPATILGSSLSFIDGSVVNVALPAMQESLDASLGTLQWVVNGYMLTLASLILLGGSRAIDSAAAECSPPGCWASRPLRSSARSRPLRSG